jgi:type II secretory pathway pseudopilin PulG
MALRTSNHCFSLIELLVALSVLALVAAIIIPRFTGLQTAAAQAIVTQNLSELNSAAAKFQALGGTCDVAAETANLLGAFHLVEFLSTPSNGQPDRGLRVDPATGGPGKDPANTFTDSAASSSIIIAAYVAIDNAANPQHPERVQPSSSSQDGFYARSNSGMNGDTVPNPPSNNRLYIKTNNQVVPIDLKNNNLSSAEFIRTQNGANGDATPGKL